MQLRVPKKYQRRRRRIFFFPGWLFRLALLVGLIFFGYWLVQNPDEAKDRVSSAANQANDEFNERRSTLVPDKPTATPDVRPETADCENAYLLGDYEAAIESCTIAIRGRPNDVELHFRLAHTLIITSDLGNDQERLAQAVDISQKAINANPESPLGWSILAMALDWSGEQNKALAAAERSQEINADFTFNKAVLANIYRNLNLFERAQISIESAIQDIDERGVSDPFVIAQVYRNYGRIFVSQGDYEGAIDPYIIASQSMPDHTYISIELAANVYYPLKQYTNAIALLDDVRTSNPRDASVLYWLSVSYAQRGETDEEIQLLTICVDAHPNYVPCLSTLGQLQFWNSPPNYILAIDNLEKATSNGSEDPYDWYLLARSYYNIQSCEQAIGPLRQGYQLMQDTTSAQVGTDNFINAGRDCGIELQ